MEETTIVIMLKDEETGFLDQELGSYSVPERAELIWSIYVKSNEVVLRLSCDRELEDWEYEAVFDYYDTEPAFLQQIPQFHRSIPSDENFSALFPFYFRISG